MRTSIVAGAGVVAVLLALTLATALNTLLGFAIIELVGGVDLSLREAVAVGLGVSIVNGGVRASS